MREVGVRELRSSLSRTLRTVAAGEPVRVTSRGRVVAEIVPVREPAPSRLEGLIAAGRVSAPQRDRPLRPPRLARQTPPASTLVLAERDAER
jgi:prevent-host-death family protein